MSKVMIISKPSDCQFRLIGVGGCNCKHPKTIASLYTGRGFHCYFTEFPENCPLKDAEKEGDE